MYHIRSAILFIITLIILIPGFSWAVEKETVVLMPLRATGVESSYRGPMETALVEGLQTKYKVFSGEQVHKKVREIFTRESRRAKECDETKCMQDIAIAFQSELIATAQVIKNSGGYLLALSIRNIFDDVAVYSKSIPCEGCNEFKVISQLKLLSGGRRSAAVAAPALSEPSGGGFDLGDLDSQATAEEAEKAKARKGKEAVKSKWSAYLDKMKSSYSQVESYERRDISKELKIKGWEKFLVAYKQDDPYSSEDEGLRKKALARIERIKTAKAGGAASEGLVFIKGGCFQMGDTFGVGASDEKPVHKVCVDDYSIGKHEVTVGEFREFVNDSGYQTEAEQGDGCYYYTGSKWEQRKDKNWKTPGFNQGEKNPVACVSWNDANKYIEWKSKKSGGNFRLPTEVEWEYAARSGGREEKYSGGNDLASVGWYTDNSGSKTHPVGQKQANGLGIYDMTGNVWEWVNDWFDKAYYQKSSENNPEGPSSGKSHVLRGGSWGSGTLTTRASNRNHSKPSVRYNSFGFRLAASSP